MLGLNKTATSMAVYGESGSYPMYTYVLKNMLSFWLHIINSPPNSLVNIAYKTDLDLTDKGNKSTWSANFRMILKYFGFEHVWNNQSTLSISRLIHAFHKVVKKQFEKYWSDSIGKSSKLRAYRTFKTVFGTEPYLINSKFFRVRRLISKFRVSNHRLEIEIGRYTDPKTPLEERICKNCNLNKVEDEYHCIIECPYMSEKRKTNFPETMNNVDTTDEEKFIDIMKAYTTESSQALYKFLSFRFPFKPKSKLAVRKKSKPNAKFTTGKLTKKKSKIKAKSNAKKNTKKTKRNALT